jgi:hypothetical protein
MFLNQASRAQISKRGMTFTKGQGRGEDEEMMVSGTKPQSAGGRLHNMVNTVRNNGLHSSKSHHKKHRYFGL